MMNEIEFYNSMVEVYKSTGQGVPGFFRTKMGNRTIDNLIKKGLIKSVVIQFNVLPDDETLCLTKGYCVEEELTSKNTMPLTYLRIYKGIPNGLEDITGIDNAKLMKDPEFMEGYVKWLKKNQSKLEENIGILSSSMVFEPLTIEESNYLQGRIWYGENKSIKDSIYELDKESSKFRKSISLNKEMMELTKNSNKYKDNYEKSKLSIEEDTKILEMRENIEGFLRSAKKQTMKIQDFYPPKNQQA